jgi:phospholipase/lecithinase/hemolysin
MKMRSKMIRKRSISTTLASTTLMILRNRLSERVWGSRGVYSPHIGQPRPRHGPAMGLAACIPSRQEQMPRELPCPSHHLARSSILDGVGVIGDSISDEYRYYAPDRATARNWVEILAETRDFSFGGPRIGTEGRDRRLAHNWSQSGATTGSLMSFVPEAGLAVRVADGSAINLAAVTIGTNDFADVLFSSRSVAAMESALERASSNFAAILNSLLGVGPSLRIAAFTAVDLRPSPLLRGIIGSGLIATPLVAAYAAAIADFNGRMSKLMAAHSHRAVVIDINDLLAGVVEAHRYALADWEINRVVASNDPRHLFLADGFHPGTIGQCLIANRFLEAVNRVFDAGIPLLGDGEMVRFAASVPKPSGLSLIGTGVLALLGYGRRCPRAA